MNRGERREISKRKWISRAKKVYYSFHHWYIPKEGIKANIPRGGFVDYFRRCESITEFLNDHKYAKLLKTCTSLNKDTFEQLDSKIQNRKERHSSKKKINEGVEEYEHLNDPECSMCIYREECEEAINGNVCFKYWD